ncbi:eIF4-gamma/eIF5/eIF2-epsilon-domain-containing protein [Fimicolochytrium jonesii]|uniref:eIF4-gamma/eIF5/eIF2-epsilon-domain-containing protein n=1 Tax=Fimicolochytrium jonesii TaxID=1396493 RepID=UPI0022FE84BC|nr:eIF4-gamma/eIF5/eIF2-epsilon-domain-containing protein [Fimicolochytrium jonesii]KAI8817971.1 eIF4-gamma/eIF5/eIF2-epsilon-domain-containing protein [Fimicolochytrium jonesii]
MSRESAAAGILLYRLRPHQAVDFLLVNDFLSHKRHWTPPKGKLIGKEDELKCALRVLPDVVGINVRDIHIEEGFRAEIKYLSGTNVKRCVFFLARVPPALRILPGGVGEMNTAWCNLKQASDRMQYKNMQDVLSQAVAFVEQLQARQTVATGASSVGGGGAANEDDGSASAQRQNRRRLGGPGRDGEKNGRNSSDDEQRRGGPNRRGGHEKAGGMVFGPNTNRSWREPQPKEGIRILQHDPAELHNGQPPRDREWNDDFRPRPNNRNGHDQNHTSASQNPLFKTRLCERFEVEGTCPYGSRCTFAHGQADLRERPTGAGEVNDKPEGLTLFKTRMCERLLKEGFCQYGPRCNFAHSESELRQRPNPHSRDHDHEDRPAQQQEQRQQPPPQRHIPRSAPMPPLIPQPPPPSIKILARPKLDADWRSGTPPQRKDTPVIAGETTSGPQAAIRNHEALPITAPATPPPPAAPVAAGPAAITTNKTRSKPDSGAAIRDLLKGGDNDKEKPWMRVLDLSELERENLQNSRHPTPPPHPANPGGSSTPTPTTTHIEQQRAHLEKSLTASLSTLLLGNNLTQQEEIKELTRIEFKHDLRKKQVFAILIGALMADGAYESARVKRRTELFRKFMTHRDDQKDLMRAVERIALRSSVGATGTTGAGTSVNGHGKAVMSKILVLLKDLYDADLVEEDIILAWHSSLSPEAADLKRRVEPFVSWLQTAEEEDEE